MRTSPSQQKMKVNVEQFVASLESDNTELGPSEIVQQHGSAAWIQARSCRVTASAAMSVSGCRKIVKMRDKSAVASCVGDKQET